MAIVLTFMGVSHFPSSCRVNMAVDRELQLQEAQKKITLKEEETFKMEAEMSKLQEQVWHNDRHICVWKCVQLEGYPRPFS
jgi:hypothetical protein